MLPEIRRLTPDQFLSLLATVQPTLDRSITSVHLHHTWRPTRAQFRGRATVEAMRNYHLSLGWSDIAQHLTIDPAGICWTGRNWNMPPASQRGKNGTAAAGPFMIEMVGDFDQGQDALDGDQRAAVCVVVAGLLAQCGLDEKAIHFHRELGSPKSCPGTGVDKAKLVAEILAAMPAGAAAPRGARGAKARKGARQAPAKQNRPLPIPLEYLASRDVAEKVGPPPDGYEDHEVREDRLAARVITQDAEARASVSTGVDVTTILSRTDDQWRELRPYVVNLSQGKLSRSGQFKMDDESIADIVAGIRAYAETTDTPRLMLHAHGGLVNEKSALGYAKGAYQWWRDHGVYPVYFIWETGAFEVIKNRLGLGRGIGDWWDGRFERVARPLGRPLWDDMKDYALKSSAADAGGGEMGGARIFAQALRVLLTTPPNGKAIRLHAVGHSAGAIFHSHFVPMLLGDSLELDSLALLAPAVRIDLFKQMIVPHLTSGRIGHFEMFTMDEEAEKDDDLIQPLGVPVYGKSLLYLVSNAFEPETRKAGILGLQERFEDDAAIVNLFKPNGVHRLEFSHAKGKPHNAATHARMHGCFDNDDPTLRSVLQTITGIPTTVTFPVHSTDCDKAASRALGIGFGGRGDAWGGPMTPDRDGWSGEMTLDRAGASSRGRRALCVGIDSYATSPLAGCVRDAKSWAAALRRLKFGVTLLLDREATRARVLDALDDLIGSARPGDSLVFQYAGHGTQAEDLNGDESDRYDEALVPIDYTTGALLLDDDLVDVYRRLPDGVMLTLFMDCCHSGTNSRFAPFDRTAARGDERRRFLELTPELDEAHRQFRAGMRAARPTTPEESLPGVIHFAACLDNQYAYESAGQGHFTRIATAALAAAAGSKTNEAYANDVASRVIALGRPQTPRLMRLPAGLEGRPLLGGRRDAGGEVPSDVMPYPDAAPTFGDDRGMAEWCLQFFEAGAAYWRQKLGS